MSSLEYIVSIGYILDRYDTYHGFAGAWSSVQGRYALPNLDGPGGGGYGSGLYQGVWRKMGAGGNSNPGGSFEDYYTVLTDSEGKERYVHNSNFVSVSRQDFLALLEKGFVVAFAGVIYGETLLGFINPENRTKTGWDAALVGNNDYQVNFLYSGNSEITGGTWSLSIKAVFLGGFNLEFGQVSDIQGTKKWYFSFGPSIGFDLSFGFQAKNIYGDKFSVERYRGYSSSIEFAFGPFDYQMYGGDNVLEKYKSDFGYYYSEDGGGISIGLPFGGTWDMSKTRIW